MKRTEGIPKEEREFQRLVKNCFESEHLVDINYFEHHLFDRLFRAILGLLELRRINDDLKDYDADLLANAHLWDFLDANLDTPQFLTIDGNDIVRNRDEIRDTIEGCISCTVHLEITPLGFY
jgi:hypothetical protein